jgi:hypothetical protein
LSKNLVRLWNVFGFSGTGFALWNASLWNGLRPLERFALERFASGRFALGRFAWVGLWVFSSLPSISGLGLTCSEKYSSKVI